MLDMNKFAGFLFFFAVLGTFSMAAQTPMVPQQEQQKVEVSDSELQKFASAFQGVNEIGLQAQQQIRSLVEDSGLNIQKFSELYQASVEPSIEVEATEKERKVFEEILPKLEKLQLGFQEQIDEVITSKDMTLERYEEIAMGLRTDSDLQKRLRAVLEG